MATKTKAGMGREISQLKKDLDASREAHEQDLERYYTERSQRKEAQGRVELLEKELHHARDETSRARTEAAVARAELDGYKRRTREVDDLETGHSTFQRFADLHENRRLHIGVDHSAHDDVTALAVFDVDPKTRQYRMVDSRVFFESTPGADEGWPHEAFMKRR